MKFLRPLFLLTIIFSIFQSHAFAQQDSVALNNIITKVKRLSEEQPVEKVYLHFDKPYYAVGDTMWFKGYVTTEQNAPSQLSKVLYVEVFNEKDSLVQSQKLPLINSVGYGNISLDLQHYKQGNYYVRAYTLWMLNFEEDYFFSKNITIGEAIDKQLITNVTYSNQEISKDIKTTTKIQFKDMVKKPLANRTVNWQLYVNYDLVTRGKGTTDANGIIDIVVSSKNGELIKNGVIIADIALNEKESASKSFELRQNYANIDFQFFPESGSFVAGIPNQVAFKAVKSDGLGVDLKGVIIDDQNTEIMQFSSGFAGMGSFFITPEANKNYKVKITYKDGTLKTYDLPKASASGVIIQNTNTVDEFINLRVLTSDQFFQANKDKTFFIVGQNTNVVYYGAQLTLKNQVVPIKIPKKNFPSGITQLTLFNAESSPISERLVFVYHQDALGLTVKSDLPSYKSRQKVTLNIAAKSESLPLAGNFSVSVIDENKVPTDDNAETTILSALLLTADLKGFVEKPNYYFNKTDDKKLADLDKLMLTQGYRRFKYQDILANKYPPVALLPEQGISISGTLRDLTGMPIKKGAVRLVVTDKPISAEAVTSNMGVFNFQNLAIPDSSQVTVSAKYNANAANLMILLNGSPTAGKGKNPNLPSVVNNIDTVLSSYLSNSAKQYRYLRTLKTVEIKGAPIKKANHADYPSLSGLSEINARTIDGSQLTDCTFLLECLKVRAVGLTYDNNEQKFYVSRDYNQGGRTPVQVFINGMPIDARDINGIIGSEVENVEVFTQDQLGTVDRMYNSKGVLAIYTKKKPVGQKISKQELLDMLPKKNILTISPQGYAKERNFYSPKYLPGKTYPNADLRTTIYWNPKVITDDKGNVSLEFYNADGKGTYKAVIEGFDKNGNVGRAVYRYTVK